MSLEVGDLAIINAPYSNIDGVFVVIVELCGNCAFGVPECKIKRLDDEFFDVGVYKRKTISVFEDRLIPT